MTPPEPRLLVPGRFSSAAIKVGEGELDVRLSDGGNWQVRVRLAEEDDWRLLCRGHLDGSIFEAGLPDDRTPVSIGPLRIDPAGRRVDVNGAEAPLTEGEFDLVACSPPKPSASSRSPSCCARSGAARVEARSAPWTPARAAPPASCARPGRTDSWSTAASAATGSGKGTRSAMAGRRDESPRTNHTCCQGDEAPVPDPGSSALDATLATGN